ncbi:tetratricopeptide repeat protein [Prochlorococcus marinus]|uniref:tetratricopeptide repeat protein n=1 Tax=Prochlorococcus marinus TaxID=1219 RepID=UPI0022B2D648|nr:tetratricopeptide repeat protein [Prochlorococcus marinus]
MESSDKNQGRKRFTEIKTFPIPFTLEEGKDLISISNNQPNKTSKETLINQALKFHLKGNLSEAIRYYKYCISHGFNDHKIFSNYGGILKDLGKLKEAELYTRKAIQLKPNYAIAYSNLGIILADLCKLKEAELYTRKAIQLKPDFAEAHSNLGNILKDLGKLKEAEISTRKAIKFQPNYAYALSNLGMILKDLGKLKEAEVYARKAIEIDPHIAMAYSNFGIILRSLGKLKEGEVYARKAIEIDPRIAMVHSNLGIILKDVGKTKEAELSTRKAIKLKPDYADAYFNLSYLELLKGKYKSGLENYEFRFKKKETPSLHGNPIIKRLDNQDLQKEEKILVISEQGLGDTLQYMRYIPYLRNQGFDISFCAQEKLHSLIQASDIDPNPLTPDQSTLVSEGQWIPLLSLPRSLKVTPKNPIISKPYIFSTDELNKKWKQLLSKEKKPIIGINWQGNPKMETTYQGRSIPLEEFSRLFNSNEITMLSLQKGFGSEQLETCSFKNKFVSCQKEIDSTWDFLENAAIIENCDLIITCDTSIAHLAGGMGKKVWLLLKDIPFWTWGLKEESTFWYPSMRLFRQKERHNWYEVMERVSNEIQKEIEDKI